MQSKKDWDSVSESCARTGPQVAYVLYGLFALILMLAGFCSVCNRPDHHEWAPLEPGRRARPLDHLHCIHAFAFLIWFSVIQSTCKPVDQQLGVMASFNLMVIITCAIKLMGSIALLW